jgi:hypothetical protein
VKIAGMEFLIDAYKSEAITSLVIGAIKQELIKGQNSP